MKSYRKSILIALVIFLLTSSACKFPWSINPTSGVLPTSTQSTLPQDDGSQARIVDSSYQPEPVNVPSLGSFTYTLNPSLSTSGDFAADGTDLMLQLTDGVGLTWTMKVPANALDLPRTIKMTAISNLQSKDIPSMLKAGVLLEPDGLQFLMPAEITVSGTGVDNSTILLTAREDGSDVELVLPGSSNNSLILHFSPVVIITSSELIDPEVDALRKKVNDQQTAFFAEVDKILANKDLVVPEPPSTPMGCKAGSQDAKAQQAQTDTLNAYAISLFTPEFPLIVKLLQNERLFDLLNGSNNLQLPEPTNGHLTHNTAYYLDKLTFRENKKLQLLDKTYQGNIEKLPAIMEVSIFLSNQIALLPPTLRETSQDMLNSLGGIIQHFLDPVLKDLSDNHNYENVPLLLKLAAEATRLGANIDYGQLVENIRKAMVFKLNLHYHFVTLTDTWDSTADFELDPSKDLNSWAGTGKADYNHTGNLKISGSKFTVSAMMNSFDACAGKANILLQGFGTTGSGSSGEQVTVRGGDVNVTSPISSLLGEVWRNTFAYAGFFQPAKTKNDYNVFVFPVTIQNLNIIAADQVFVGTVEQLISLFHVILTHHPVNYANPLPQPEVPFTNGADATVQATPGSSQSNLPQDVAMYPNVESNTTSTGGMTLLRTKDSPDQVIAFYTEQMINDGWTAFPTQEIGNGTILGWMKGTRMVSISVIAQDGLTNITIQITGQ